MKTTYDHLPYRPCVGMTLFNKDGKVFVGERLDYPGAWQMPQGGIDDGEDTQRAFFRELREEIGTDKADILRIMDTPLKYDLPPRLLGKLWDGKYRGQEQTWVAARFKGTDEDIKIDAYMPQEFGRWQWVKLDDVIDLIVPFKRDTYRTVIDAFRDLI
jgi:putative (di)nucleoside polyphosphate hydrolase